jgi:GNAT superfamily N-acetyltransferase
MTAIVRHVDNPDAGDLTALYDLMGPAGGTTPERLARRFASPVRSLLMAPDGIAELALRTEAVAEVWVRPGAAGVASAELLIPYLIGVVRAHGAASLSTHAVVGTDVEALWQAHELALESTDCLLECRIDAVAAHRPPAGYALEVFEGEAPEAWAAGVARAKQSVGDIDPSSPIDWAVAELRRQTAVQARRGVLHTVVAHTDGDVVAFTDVVVPRGDGTDPTRAHQAGTGVAPGHRGRRLSAALKSASAQAVRARHPEVTVVETTVDDGNAAMLAVNASLGFTIVRRTASLVLTLSKA